MNISDKDRIIIAQVAVKEAATLYQGRGPDLNEGQFFIVAQEVHETLWGLIRGQEPAGAAQAVESVVNQFPGAQVVPQPTPVPVAAPAPLPQPAAAAQPPAGGPVNANSSVEQLWADVFNNADNWYDNRGSKTNPKSPDFKHKTIKSGQYFVALWVDSDDTPAWVKQQLGIA